ncbi:transcriptional repressor [Candidatus Saccharibacteria bacterium]|nr:transcriptional repressor [Candidatus Saccharibacteria bacterium]
MQKQSIQRDVVKNDVLHRFDHPTAEMVHFSARQKCPRISLATVYRHLENLTKEGLIHKFTVPGEPDHYDATANEHIHALCESCGEIYDITVRLSKILKRQVEKGGKIKLNDYQLLASGICHKCNKSERKNNEKSKRH